MSTTAILLDSPRVNRPVRSPDCHPCVSLVLRKVLYIATIVFIFLALGRSVTPLEFSATIIAFGGARLLTQFLECKGSKLLKGASTFWDLSLITIGVLGVTGTIGFGETVLATMTWSIAPFAMVALLVVVAVTVLGFYCCCKSSGPSMREMMSDDFDIGAWSIQESIREQAERRRVEHQAAIKEGTSFIQNSVSNAITSEKAKADFESCEVQMMQFIHSKAVFEYTFGSKKLDPIPIYFNTDAKNEIKRLRSFNRVINVPKELTECFSDYTTFCDHVNYLKDHTAIMLFNDVIKVPLKWQTDPLIRECYNDVIKDK